MHDRLRTTWRHREDRDNNPLAAILDVQSTRFSPQGGENGCAKAQQRAKVEVSVPSDQVRFNHRKARTGGVAEKNTAQFFSLCGLANLMLAKRYLQRAAG